MTDDELIEKVQTDFTPAEFDRLIALARIGSAVQPRPISEAPKDGRGLILICGNWTVTGSWHRHQNCWVNNGPIYERIPANEQPTHFIEQSALPQPKKE